MAIRGRILHVADRAARCVRRFEVSALDERLSIGADRLTDPTGVAVDSQARIYVLDNAVSRVLRFLPNGALDVSYAPAVVLPKFIAITDADDLLVSDASGEIIRIFDPEGASAGLVVALASQSAMQPRALAVRGNLLLAANAADGSILVFDLAERWLLGEIVDFRGPVDSHVLRRCWQSAAQAGRR